MADTARLRLPLLESGQAQKHVTVNEALARLDALGSPTVASRSLAAPPAAPAEGAVWVVGPSSEGAWAGWDGALAVRANGGWIFHAPEPGRRVWIEDEGGEAVFDGAAWLAAPAARRLGAGLSLAVATLDHSLSPGASALTAPVIPDKAVVIGVTGRVLSTLSGPGLTSWRLGAEGAPGRYGSGYGVSAGSFAKGVTGAPVAYYAPTALLLEAEGGSFEGGVVRLAVHYLDLAPPAWP